MTDRLQEIKERWAKVTAKEWHWNSYSQIFAEVDEQSHPLVHFPEDGPNINGKYLAIVAWVDGGPKQTGDELFVPEARANALAIAGAPADIAWLCSEVERLRGELHPVCDCAWQKLVEDCYKDEGDGD